MNVLFQKAVETVAKLSIEEQQALAEFLLPEASAVEAQWGQAFEASKDALGHLAEEALAEHRTARPTGVNE